MSNEELKNIIELINTQKFEDADLLINTKIDSGLELPEKAEFLHQRARLRFYQKLFSEGVQVGNEEISILEKIDPNHPLLGEAYMVRAYNYHMQKEFHVFYRFFPLW